MHNMCFNAVLYQQFNFGLANVTTVITIKPCVYNSVAGPLTPVLVLTPPVSANVRRSVAWQ